MTIGTVADTGYTVTFNALTPLGSARQTGLGDVPQLDGHAARPRGTVTTTTQGKPGIGQGACTNSGDGHIRYDQLAKRWLFTTPSFTRVGGLYAMCHAVSVGTDPTGPFYRYVFRRSLFPDYPRVAVWPDAYYNATSTGDNVIEKHACAVDRTRMLQGLDATEQCIIVPAVSFMEPADLDGYGAPAGRRARALLRRRRLPAAQHLRGRRHLQLQVPRRLRRPVEVDVHRPGEDRRLAVSLPLRRPAHAVRAAAGQHHAAGLPGRQDHAPRRLPQPRRRRVDRDAALDQTRGRRGRRALVRDAPRRRPQPVPLPAEHLRAGQPLPLARQPGDRPQGRHRARLLLRRRPVHPADRDDARPRPRPSATRPSRSPASPARTSTSRPGRKINIGTGATLETRDGRHRRHRGRRRDRHRR